MTRAEEIDFEQAVYDAFGQVKDFTLAMRIARYFYEKAEKDLALTWEQEPQGLDEAAKEFLKNYIPFDQIDSRDIIRLFKAGALWMAGQGVTMQITDDTQWEEVDRFVHRNCDGASCIQIRKK